MSESNKNEEKTDEAESQKVEDDGEDLPDNFFDDFQDQDFMDGLNVVDDWNDEDENAENPENGKNEEVSKQEREKPKEERSERPRRDYDKGSYSRYRRSNSRGRRSRSRGRRSRSRNRYDHQATLRRREGSFRREYPVQSPRRSDGIDRRRDPEKTKRDIQRDKLRCAKDHEARVFQEQLKIAETGLVPPGTELDVVLSSDKFKKATPATKKPVIQQPPREKIKIDKIEDPIHQKVSPNRSSRISSSRRRKSHHSLSREKSYSPKRRKRSSTSRERKHRYHDIPETDLRYRIREKRERLMLEGSPVRSMSPLYLMSPRSNISEREAWLRSREQYRSKRHSRSLSPVNTSRIRDASPKEKKFTFLEEIEIKLRQTQPKRDQNQFNMVPVLPQLMSTPIQNPEFMQTQMPFQHPAPIPPPGMFPIGEQYQQPLMMCPDPNLMPPILFPNSAPMFPHGLPPYPVPQPVPAPAMYMSHTQNPPIQNQMVNAAPTQGVNQENPEITKLFEDKKISLSDFLSVSAKPLDSSAPLDIHNKIKVLSRCQEAMKILEDPKFIGRFIPRVSQKLMEAEKRAAENKGNNQSPLRKAVTVRFNFTVPDNRRLHSKNIDQQAPKMALHKLMNILGMPDNVDLQSPIPEEIANQLEEKKKEVVLSTASQVPVEFSRRPVVETFSASTQTEPLPCEECEKRKSIKYIEEETQTTKEVSEMATQVSVEDLTKSCTTFIPRGILKSTSSPVKSISHLTPAQLLAQLECNKPEDTSPQKQERYPPIRRPLLDHQMSSDKTEPPNFNNSPGNNYGPDRFDGHMSGPAMGYNMGRVGNFNSPMGDRGAMSDRGGLLKTPYPNRPYQNPGPNPNMPNYPNQGRSFHEQMPTPNLSIWGNSPMGRGSQNPGMGRGNPGMGRGNPGMGRGNPGTDRVNPQGFSNMPNHMYYNQRGPN